MRSRSRALGPVLCACGAAAETLTLRRPHQATVARARRMFDVVFTHERGMRHIKWHYYVQLMKLQTDVTTAPNMGGMCRRCWAIRATPSGYRTLNREEELLGSWDEVDEYDSLGRRVGTVVRYFDMYGNRRIR